MTGTIYKYTNKMNNMSYIGQTLNIKERRKSHENCLANDKFHKALRYYGLINFDFSIVETDIPENKLDEREKYWIKYYDSFHNGYNSSKGGEQLKMKLSKKTRKELGKHAGGQVIFGYKLNENYDYIIDEEKSKIVESVFKDYINGLTITMLDKKYNFRRSQAILNRDLYYGSNSKYPKIIDKELFDKVQSIKNGNRIYHKKNQHPLKGILYDENDNLYTTNGCLKKFIQKDNRCGFKYEIADILLKKIKCKYDKIKVKRLQRYVLEFSIYNNGKYIKSININTYNKRVLYD